MDEARDSFAAVAQKVKNNLDVGGEIDSALVGEWRRTIKRHDICTLMNNRLFPATLSCVELGTARLLFLPGEWFHSYGIEFAASNAEGPVITTTLSGFDLLYIPDRSSMPFRDRYGVATNMRSISDDAVHKLAADALALLRGEPIRRSNRDGAV